MKVKNMPKIEKIKKLEDLPNSERWGNQKDQGWLHILIQKDGSEIEFRSADRQLKEEIGMFLSSIMGRPLFFYGFIKTKKSFPYAKWFKLESRDRNLKIARLLEIKK